MCLNISAQIFYIIWSWQKFNLFVFQVSHLKKKKGGNKQFFSQRIVGKIKLMYEKD